MSLAFLASPSSAYKSIEEQPPAIVSNELTVGKNTPTTERPSEQKSTASTLSELLNKITNWPFASSEPVPATSTTTTTTSTTTTPKASPELTSTTAPDYEDNNNNNNNDSGPGDDDHDAEGCKGVSADEPAEAKNLTDHERLVNLQSCLQSRVKRKLLGATRSGLELFERLSLSGGCSSSLMSFAGGLGELKSYAFKFLDASAKIPSGVMFGLLSDFGDFDQCLSIRSRPGVDPQVEADEGAFSGKYCLVSVKLKYHIQLAANETVPEGIYPDGILWDELIRNYWTSNSTTGFQMGVCVPSRCNADDLDQIYRLVAQSYNFQGQVLSCQDSNDLRAQLTPDSVQLAIIYTFGSLVGLALIGTLVERYCLHLPHQCGVPLTEQPRAENLKPGLALQVGRQSSGIAMAVRLLTCFSVIRNWKIFMRKQDAGHDLLADNGRQSIGLRFVCKQSSHEESIETRTSDRSMVDSSRDSFSDLSMESAIKTTPMTLVYSDQLRVRTDAFEDNNKEGHQDEDKLATISFLPSPVPAIASRSTIGTHDNVLSHLSGLKLLVIVWITVGHSFLYPSANNYQYYRSIINMNITRDSVWFATTNFTLGIDTLLYITGLVFVYNTSQLGARRRAPDGGPTCSLVLRSIARKVLRFWPTYLAMIGLAIVVPLVSDGPMWPEMVTRRLGATCRTQWWANLLVMNNFFSESQICLPSSWFVSVLMQMFLVGSIILLLVSRFSLALGMSVLTLLLLASSGLSFGLAYYVNIRAPAIRMDESFVMELDDNIFRLYTSLFNNLGPFLLGMAGGFVLLRSIDKKRRRQQHQTSQAGPLTRPWKEIYCSIGCELVVAITVGLVAVLVLSSVFHGHYTRAWASVYWALHRVGWAIVSGYLIHQCATGKWRLLYDVLSLSTFIPLSRLIFIAYLIHPIFIHVHSGLVRDGLHVSIYNMMNIYITRLAMTFTLALIIHLLVELPCCSIEQILLDRLISRRQPKTRTTSTKQSPVSSSSSLPSSASSSSLGQLVGRRDHPPLLAVASANMANFRVELANCTAKPCTGIVIDGKRVGLGPLNESTEKN